MRSVILTAGPSCFTACPGCYNHFARRTVSTESLLKFVRGLRDRAGLSKITLGGGDPLTRPDLIDLLSGLRQLGLRMNLDTVGTAFVQNAEIRFMGRGTALQIDVGRVASLVDLIGIPLDGSSDAVLNRFRTHLTVAAQEAVLNRLAAVEATVCLNTVVHAGNTEDLPEIGKIVSRYPCIRLWQLFQFMPIGPLGWRNRARFQITPGRFQAAANSARSAIPEGVTIEAKEALDRKNRYLLIDAAGTIWIPDQTSDPFWSSDDQNEHRRSLGTITDRGIVDRIAELDDKDGAAE